MTDAYCIWIVTPPDYEHAGAFTEIALGLQGGFSELGIQVPVITRKEHIRGRAIVLGANLLPRLPGVKPPGKCILFNLEQITPGSPWLTRDYVKLLKRHQVWDYSLHNIEQLEKLGVRNIAHCPVGFSNRLQRIEHAADKDIDVLFYGSLNERRLAIIENLAGADLRVETLFGVYGDERDAMIARSRIVLNVHYYPSKIFEIVRISWLLANGVCVVSEESPPDSALEAVKDGIVQASYDALTTTCRELIDSGDWKKVAQKGFEVFSAGRQADYLRDILIRTAA